MNKKSQESKRLRGELTEEKKKRKEVEKEKKDWEKEKKDWEKVKKKLEDKIRMLEAKDQSSESHQEAVDSHPKKKLKSNTSASASGHQIGDNCDNNGQPSPDFLDLCQL